LTALNGTQDTFDLKIVGNPVEFDLIIDPTIVEEDIGGVVGIGTGETTITTLTTDHAANKRIIILATIEMDNTNTSVETIAAGDLRLKIGSTILDDNFYTIEFGRGAGAGNPDREQDDHHMMLIASRTTESANEVFEVTALASATGINAQARIASIVVLEGYEFDAAEVTGFSNTETTLATLNTNFKAGEEVVVISRTQFFDNAATNSVPVGNFKLKQGATVLYDNFFLFEFGDNDPGSETEEWVLADGRTTVSADESFTTTIQTGAALETGDAQTKMVAFKVNEVQRVESGHVDLLASETTVATLATTYPANEEIFVLGIMQIVNPSSGGSGSAVDIAAGDVRLKQGATVLDDNGIPIQIERRQGDTGNVRYITGFFTNRTTETANESYSMTVNPSVTLSDAHALILAIDLRSTNPFENGWDLRKKISIESSQVPSDLTDFPVLIKITDLDLSEAALKNGDDILFTESDGETKLDHEINYYDHPVGDLTAWIRIPTLSSTVDTEIYMYYGNPLAINQENATGVWDKNYVAVYHMEQDPTVSTDCGDGGASTF